MPANDSVEIIKVPTTRPDYFVRVALNYNDGSMRRSNRGYYASVYVIREERNMWACNMMGKENTNVRIEYCDRFNRKKFDGWADDLKAYYETNVKLGPLIDEPYIKLDQAIDHALELAPEVNV